jgi:hypothetical protein
LQSSSRTVEILPLSSAPIVLSRRYTIRYGDANAAKLREQFPHVRMSFNGNEALVEGRLEDHESLAEWLKGPQSVTPPRGPTRGTRQVYTLRVQEQPLRTVLQTLAEKLQWQLQIDETALQAAGLSLDMRVSFDVKDASENALLEAILRPAGFGYRREGERIVVVPMGAQ